MSIGPAEIIIVLILALLVFGPSRLPQMGKSLGKGLREFRKAADTAKTEFGLGEVTDQINEVKIDVHRAHQGGHGHVHRPQVQRRPQVGHRGAGRGDGRGRAAAVAGGGLGGAAEGSAPTPAAAPAPARAEGAFDEGPETPPVTPQTAFADVAPAPPEEPAGAPRRLPTRPRRPPLPSRPRR